MSEKNYLIENCFKSDDKDVFSSVCYKKNCSIINDNRGIGVVEIVLILVVLVALVIIFKDKITEIISNAFSSITSGADSL